MAFSLSDYKDLKELGRGGMGVVYLAVQSSLGRKVAIKKMAVNIADSSKLVKRFEVEAKSAASLDHDNIIRIYEFGEEDGAFYMSMEYVDGPDLDQLLKDKHTPREVCLMIMVQALKGLEYAHRSGIIHRDIKPGNILVSKNGRAKVVDFGLAHVGETSLHLTATDAIVGTPLFMSPEQATGAKERDARSDIFSVGVLLYRILTGKFPFSGSNVPAILYSIIHTKETPVGDAAPTVPEDLATHVNQCLEKDIQKRLPKLGPLIESLQNHVYELGVRDPADEVARQINTTSSTISRFLSKLLEYHMSKGKAYAESGEINKSRAHFEEVLKYDPGNREISGILSGLQDIEITVAEMAVPELDVTIPGEGAEKRKRREERKGLLVWSVAAGVVFLTVIAAVILGMNGGGDEQQALADKPVAVSQPAAAKPEPRKPAQVAAKPKKASRPVSRKPRRRKPQRRPEKVSVWDPAEVRKASYGTLYATVDPSDADVYLDHRRVNAREIRSGMRVKAGNHTLRVTADGYETKEEKVYVGANSTSRHSISLKSARTTGMLHVYSKPWAEIYIDGRKVGISPTQTPIELRPGKHALVLRRSGFEPIEEIITIQRGKRTNLRHVLEKEIE